MDGTEGRYLPRRPFPPYAFLPGRDPHPTSDPRGHSFRAEPEPPARWLPAERWQDNDDYLFASAWNRAEKAGDGALAARIEQAYVPYMTAKVAYYEDQARALFGREIPLVLLVHANSINARRFGDLADALEARGYRFVALAEALADPAYDSADTYTGPAGISWIHRWAISRDVDRGFFRGEPDVPGWLSTAAPGE